MIPEWTTGTMGLALRVSLASSFICGVLEFRSDLTLTQVDDLHYEAYDRGRDFAHKVTLRHFDHK